MMYDEKSVFAVAVKHCLKFEGGYVNDPKDRGGSTKYGISQRAYPHLDIANLTVEQATELYRQDYWLAINLDRVAKYLPSVAIKIFDISVNMGVAIGGKLLQRALNVYQDRKLVVDGIIGRNTMAAVESVKPYMESCMVAYIATLQRKRYNWIVARRPSQVRFIRGWLRRAKFKPNFNKLKDKNYA